MTHDLPATRHSLILRLRAQSGDAWAMLLQVYEGAIYRYCLARGLQPADACDATQEVFAALYERLDSWDIDPAKGSFRGWMFRVAHNVAVDKIAYRAPRAGAAGCATDSARLAAIPDVAEEERTAFLHEYRRSLFQWAVDQVRPEASDASWQAFQMTALEGLDSGTVARRLGMSVGSVYTAKCRIVAKIRAKLAKLDEDNFDLPDTRRNE